MMSKCASSSGCGRPRYMSILVVTALTLAIVQRTATHLQGMGLTSSSSLSWTGGKQDVSSRALDSLAADDDEEEEDSQSLDFSEFDASTDNQMSKKRFKSSEQYAKSLSGVCDAMANETHKPHFIIVGAQKAGTSALNQLLRRHPQMVGPAKRFLPKTSETHFFHSFFPEKLEHLQYKPIDFDDHEDDEAWCEVRREYSKIFYQKQAKGQEPAPFLDEKDVMYYEKTPAYLYLRYTPAIIKRACPWKPKIIVMLRNPVDRALSHYQMEYRKELMNPKYKIHHQDGITKGTSDFKFPSFERLAAKEIAAMRHLRITHAPQLLPEYLTEKEIGNGGSSRFESFQDMGRHDFSNHDLMDGLWMKYRKVAKSFNYLHRGMYYEQLLNWNRYFPIGESMLVLNYDEFKLDNERINQQICDFLGVPYTPQAETVEANTAPDSHYSKEDLLPPSTREYLETFYRPYNDKLAELLGPEWENVWQS